MSLTEWVGFFSALIYLYFSIKQNIWLWPMGIISSLFYMVVFLSAHLYADMILQVYYLIVSVWGWIFWKKKQEESETHTMDIINTSIKDFLWISLAFSLLYIVLVIILLKVPTLIGIASSEMPYLDAFTTAGSFVATWMLVKKRIEQWLLWIVIDLVSIGMYIYKELYLTTVLFFIYTVMAVAGYLMWLKDLKKKPCSVNVNS